MLQMLRHGNARAGARRLCGAAASSGRLRACQLVLERWRLLGWEPMAVRWLGLGLGFGFGFGFGLGLELGFES